MNSLPIMQWEHVKRRTYEFAAMDRAEIEHNTLFRTERRCYEEVGPCQSKPIRKLPSFKRKCKE